MTLALNIQRQHDMRYMCISFKFVHKNYWMRHILCHSENKLHTFRSVQQPKAKQTNMGCSLFLSSFSLSHWLTRSFFRSFELTFNAHRTAHRIPNIPCMHSTYYMVEEVFLHIHCHHYGCNVVIAAVCSTICILTENVCCCCCFFYSSPEQRCLFRIDSPDTFNTNVHTTAHIHTRSHCLLNIYTNMYYP